MLKKILCAVAGLVLCLGLAAGAAEAENMERETLNFNTGWLYYGGDCTNGAALLLDDSEFEEVSVPHANITLDKHKGPDFQAQIEKYRFVSWYRRHFELTDEQRSAKSVIVEFQGVATVARIYVNGQFVGQHKGAYTGFSFDIAPYLKSGDNVIAVKVDSTKQSGIPPEGGSVDYCLFGGIVRDVSMIITNPLHIDNTFFSTPNLTAESGTVNAEIALTNSWDEDKSCHAELYLYDADGKLTTKAVSDETSIGAGENATLKFESDEISEPYLWDVDDPYLYTLETKIISDGEVVDTCSDKIGMRFFEFRSGDTDASFYLNGRKLELRGVNRHEQWPWQGRAIPNRLQERDAELLKESGFNAVRCSHYPQDPEFLSRCDELGLIVFEEAPGWQYIGDSAWQEIYKENVREMIIRDRNHPSIVTWGVRVNESWDNVELVTETCAISKELDPTRPTHGVRRNENYNSTQMIEDIFCNNYQYPETPRYTPFVSTEHSWECWTNGKGLPDASDADAMDFTKSFADVVDYYYGNDLCAGGFAWSMFDYNNEVNYTKTNNVFYSGIYDIFRLDKPVAHFYEAQKDVKDGVNIYIANYWIDSSPSTVEIYSNCDEVELFVNGVSKGKISPNTYLNVPHPAFRFEDIAFEAGELRAVGYIDGEAAAEFTRLTPETPAKLVVTPDYSVLTADGSDMTSVTIELVDENGTRMPYAANEVTIEVEGCGDFIGEKTIALEGGRCAFLLRTRHGETGKVHCTVSADGIEAGECDVTVQSFDEENIVPYSDGDGNIKPIYIKELNDTDEAFEYSGSWSYCSQSGAYKNDNYYSLTANDTVTVTFEGDVLRWYGTKAPAHGIMAVSTDGGEEIFIDCYASSRSDNVLLYSTPSLGGGTHTVTVRVTGDKNASATDTYINADRVQILERADSVKSVILKSADSLVGDGSTWSVEGDKLVQAGSSFGDHTAIFEGDLEDVSIEAYVPVPTKDDTGCSVMGRIVDASHFYQLEMKLDDGELIWAIWKNSGGTWITLASGPMEAVGDEVGLKLRIEGSILSALCDNGNGYVALGSATDSTYSVGSIGLRTHNRAATFTGMLATELENDAQSEAVITDIAVSDGKLSSATVSSRETELNLICAVYAADGSLIAAERVTPENGKAVLGGESLAEGGKLLLWKTDDSLAPLGKAIEF